MGASGGLLGLLPAGWSTMQGTLVGALIVDFGIQLCGWAVAASLKTEKFYDLLGSTAFLSVAALSLASNATIAPRQALISTMVMVWGARLGSFLLRRIMQDGKDSRFDGVRESPERFLVFWTLQGVWVWVTSLPLLMVNGTLGQPGLYWMDFVGAALWACGFATEACADWQKSKFRADPANSGNFINTGLWSLSRHPNYFGEIMCWVGAFVVSIGGMGSWWQLPVSALSPMLVTLLLTKVSGIPLLQAAAEKKWGHLEAYQEYKAETRLLVPFLPQKSPSSPRKQGQ